MKKQWDLSQLLMCVCRAIGRQDADWVVHVLNEKLAKNFLLNPDVDTRNFAYPKALDPKP